MVLDRGLASINRKLSRGPQILQRTIRAQLRPGRTVRVLEIGCGVGAALMELAHELRHEDVRFAALNREKGAPIASREDLRHTAERLGLDFGDRADDLPELFFEDATSMHFGPGSFDVVYSSSVVRFIPDKARFLEEVARLLRPGGVAILRIEGKGWDYPYSVAEDGLRLTSYPARWILRHGCELIPLEPFLHACSGDAYRIELPNAPSFVLSLEKLRDVPLKLDLVRDERHSVPMRRLRYGQRDLAHAKSGLRSVYEVPEPAYRRLFELGFLRSGELGKEPARFRTRSDDPRIEERAAARNCRRLSSYEVGQRIKIKGRRSEAGFRAAKIKMIHHHEADDHLEGTIERVDREAGTLGVVGFEVRASSEDAGAQLADLEVGITAKVKGEWSGGAFLAREIRVLPEPAVVVEEIQARVEGVDVDRGTVRVAGVIVETHGRTKIDRPSSR